MEDRKRYVGGTALREKRLSLAEDYEKMKRRASVEKGRQKREAVIYENAYVYT